MASLGKSRHASDEATDSKKKKLINLLSENKQDPLNLVDFNSITNAYRAGIGNKKRKLVFTAFNMFFKDLDEKLNWATANEFV